MKKAIFFLSVLFSATLAMSQQQQEPYKSPTESKITGSTASKYDFKIITDTSKTTKGLYTYGYDIYSDGVLKFHQPSMPAMPGNDGFKTKMDAQKVAKLAINKLYKGEIPPTITVAELKSLGVVK